MYKYLLLILLFFPSISLADTKDVQVLEQQYVLYAKGVWCIWNKEIKCPKKGFSPGIYLLKGDPGKWRFLTEYPLQKPVPYNSKLEADFCNGIQGACSANLVYYASDDPLTSKQWSLPYTNIPKSRNHTGVTTLTIIGVVDTGVDCKHPDILCESNGYNAITQKPVQIDDNGHGTHVAGIACATIDNNIGIQGAVNCKVLPVKFMGSNGSGTLYAAAKALNWLLAWKRSNPSKSLVINNSWGSFGKSDILASLISDLIAEGVIVIAAAGNSATNSDLHPYYPAQYPGVISVGALSENGSKASFSNYGKSVTIWSPGVQIVSTWLGEKYRYLSGTSMAAPLVAGILASGLNHKSVEELIANVSALKKLNAYKITSCNVPKLTKCRKKCKGNYGNRRERTHCIRRCKRTSCT